MSTKGDGIGTIFINNKNYKGLKVGTSSVKRKYNIPDENGYTVLKIKCSTESNILNIFNQLNSNVESIGIFNESNININTNTTLPNLNVDNGSINQYTTWTLPDGNYKVFIKGEFSAKDSTCEILKVKLQNNLTTGYKMFYNCNIVKANSDYEIKIPDSMTNTESMFENSNINRTVKVNLLTTTRCFAMYKNCTNLKKIHINYINVFNNENELCPNLSESDCDECFAGCGNIRCGNLNSDTNNKPAIFSWANIPYSWGGLEHFNTFEIEANDTNGLTLTLVQYMDDDGTIEALVRTDWGDGTIDNELSHTYSKSGTYIVKTKLQPNNMNTENYNKLIKKVIDVRDDISNFAAFCLGCLNMEQFNIDNIIHPTDMNAMFFECQSLTSIDMTKFDTSNVTDMNSMFYDCNSLTSLNLSSFDTSKVTNMSWMFYYCNSLTSLNLSNFDTSKVTDMSYMFYLCKGLTSLNVSSFNTSNVTNMGGVFYKCNKLTSLDLSNFNTSAVYNIASMFEGCSALTSLDLTSFNINNSVDSEYLLSKVPSNIEIKVTSSFEKTEAQCNWDGQFYIVDLIMKYTYNGTTPIIPSLPSGYTYTLKDVVNDDGSTTRSLYNSDWIGPNTYYQAFYSVGNKNNITSIDYIRIDNNCTNLSECFRDCGPITNINFSKYSDTSNITDMSYAFSGCYKLTSLDLSSFDSSKVIYMQYMFFDSAKLVSLDLSNFDTRNVTTMSAMFHNCYKLTSLDLSSFNTSKVTSMSYMFDNCGLTSLDLSNFNTSNVTDMRNMFCFCQKLTSLNVSSFDTSKVTSMSNMFQGCKALTSLDLSSFNTSLVTDMYNMFRECNLLASLNLTSFNINSSVNSENSLLNVPSNIEIRVTSSFEKTEAECNWEGQFYIVDLIMKYTYTGTTDILPVFPSGYTYTLKDVANEDGSTTRSLYNSNWIGPNTYKNTFGSIADKNNIIRIDYMRIDNNCTSLYGCFNGCNSIANISFSRYNDTNKVTDMSFMFYNCRALTSLDLSNFNTSAVNKMDLMFSDCYSLVSLNVSNFDTSNVTNMLAIFAECRALTSLDLSNFDTSKVADMESIFNGCEALTSLNLSGFNTSSATTMDSMFRECNSLKSLNLSSFDTSKVTNMRHMFYKCNALTSLDLSNFNTSAVTIMSYMFGECGTLTSLDLSSFNTASLSNISNMFDGCSKLTSLDLPSFNTTSLSNISNMFSRCNKLKSLDLSNFNTSNVTNMSYTFYQCSALTSLDLSNFNTSKVTDMSYMFYKCSVLTSLNLSNFNTSLVTDMKYMFYQCSALTSLDLSSFNTPNVTNMGYMFRECKALTSLDLSSFNTPNVTNMEYVFYQCSALTSLDLSSFNTSKVTSMFRMFYNCYALTSLDLSNFDTSKLTNMSYMFNECKALTSLDLSSFNTSNITNISYMFSGCTSLKSLDLTSFNIKSSVSSTNSLLNVPSDAIIRVTSSFKKTEAQCDWTGTFKRPIAYYKYTNLVEDGDNSYIADSSGNNYNIGLGFLPTEVAEKGIYINGRSSSPSISYPITENGFTIKYKVYNMDAGSGATFFKCMSGPYANNLGWWLGIGDSNIKVRTKNVWFKNTKYLDDESFMDENSSPMIYQFNEVVLSMNKNKLYLNVNGVIYRNTNLNITSSFDSLAISLIADQLYTQSARYYFYKSEVYNEYLEI